MDYAILIVGLLLIFGCVGLMIWHYGKFMYNKGKEESFDSSAKAQFPGCVYVQDSKSSPAYLKWFASAEDFYKYKQEIDFDPPTPEL